MAVVAQALPPSALPGISPTGGESDSWCALRLKHTPNAQQPSFKEGGKRAPSILPPCGGDARQGRGGYGTLPTAQKLPGKNIAWR
jgi:hypothetical protein